MQLEGKTTQQKTRRWRMRSDDVMFDEMRIMMFRMEEEIDTRANKEVNRLECNVSKRIKQ